MSVAETANTQITIFSGTTQNQYGDVIDANTPRLQSLPATLVETSRKTQDPSTPTPRTVRDVVLHVPYWAEVTTDDRIMDERTQDIYMVIEVTRPSTIIGAPVDELVKLKRITANTT